MLSRTAISGPARRLAGLEDRAAHPVDRPAGNGESVHPMPEPQPDQTGGRCVPGLPFEGRYRTHAQIMDLFDGLELVEPGLVLVPDWRPDPGTPGVRDHPVLQMACVGVARKGP